MINVSVWKKRPRSNIITWPVNIIGVMCQRMNTIYFEIVRVSSGQWPLVRFEQRVERSLLCLKKVDTIVEDS